MPYKYNPFTGGLDWFEKSEPSISVEEIEGLARGVDRTVEEIENIVRGVAGAGMQYSEVSTFADLPIASENAGKICVVKTATGIWLINKKQKGLYRSNGSGWGRLGIVPQFGDLTNPPSGKYKITNIYYDALEDEQVLICSDNPEP